jgi:2,6-dihydroxypyridine 3-monooxygenase
VPRHISPWAAVTRGPRVVVVGGSLAGLTAALVLRDGGCDVEVFERTPVTLEGRGAGIVLHPRTVQYLVEHAPSTLRGVSTSARWFRYLAEDEGVVHEEPCRYRFTSYTSIYHPLRVLLGDESYHVDEAAVDFEQDADGVTVRFASGRIERCDMLVCADGINSTGRRKLLPDAEPEYAGYIAWRGTLDESELRDATRDVLHEAIVYSLNPRGGHVLAYPIPGPEIERGGPPLTNWLWYRNLPPDELDAFLVDREGRQLTASVPPGSVQPHLLRRLREDAGDQLPAPLAELLHRTPEPFVQVIFDVGSERMAFERICLIGDAAFSVRPHVAAGAAKGADDAWALGDAMLACGQDVRAALERWEPGQLALGRHVLDSARTVGTRVQFDRTWEAGEPLPFGLRERGDGSIDAIETGVRVQ